MILTILFIQFKSIAYHLFLLLILEVLNKGIFFSLSPLTISINSLHKTKLNAQKLAHFSLYNSQKHNNRSLPSAMFCKQVAAQPEYSKFIEQKLCETHNFCSSPTQTDNAATSCKTHLFVV